MCLSYLTCFYSCNLMYSCATMKRRTNFLLSRHAAQPQRTFSTSSKFLANDRSSKHLYKHIQELSNAFLSSSNVYITINSRFYFHGELCGQKFVSYSLRFVINYTHGKKIYYMVGSYQNTQQNIYVPVSVIPI